MEKNKMAWNPDPKVADCREIANKWGCDQVITIGVDLMQGTFRIVSYGKTKALCDKARKINDAIHDLIMSGDIEVV